jgi:hypothetical protein
MKLFRNIDIPATPIMINIASESEQNKATVKT